MSRFNKKYAEQNMKTEITKKEKLDCKKACEMLKRSEGASIFAIAVGHAIKEGVENGTIQVEVKTERIPEQPPVKEEKRLIKETEVKKEQIVEKQTAPTISESSESNDFSNKDSKPLKIDVKKKVYSKEEYLVSVTNKSRNYYAIRLKNAADAYLVNPNEHTLDQYNFQKKAFSIFENIGVEQLSNNTLEELVSKDQAEQLNILAYENNYTYHWSVEPSTEEQAAIVTEVNQLCSEVVYIPQIHVYLYYPETGEISLSILPYNWVEPIYFYISTFLMSILGFLSGTLLVVLIIFLITCVVYLLDSRRKITEEKEIFKKNDGAWFMVLLSCSAIIVGGIIVIGMALIIDDKIKSKKAEKAAEDIPNWGINHLTNLELEKQYKNLFKILETSLDKAKEALTLYPDSEPLQKHYQKIYELYKCVKDMLDHYYKTNVFFLPPVENMCLPFSQSTIKDFIQFDNSLSSMNDYLKEQLREAYKAAISEHAALTEQVAQEIAAQAAQAAAELAQAQFFILSICGGIVFVYALYLAYLFIVTKIKFLRANAAGADIIIKK